MLGSLPGENASVHTLPVPYSFFGKSFLFSWGVRATADLRELRESAAELQGMADSLPG